MAEIALHARDGSIRALALIDEADAEWLGQWRWSLSPEGYARRGKSVKMHRQILGLERGDKLQGDHINGDRLDNRRVNLRVVTARENGWNRLSYAGSSSRFRGVTFHKATGKWQAQVKYEGRFVYVGLYADELVAALAARRKRVELFGEIAA